MAQTNRNTLAEDHQPNSTNDTNGSTNKPSTQNKQTWGLSYRYNSSQFTVIWCFITAIGTILFPITDPCRVDTSTAITLEFIVQITDAVEFVTEISAIVEIVAAEDFKDAVAIWTSVSTFRASYGVKYNTSYGRTIWF